MMDIQWLVSTGPCKMFKQGQNIPCPGGPEESDRAMYILLTGRVDAYKASAAGGTQLVGSMLAGDVFGGREYFAGAKDYTYIAAQDSAVFVINEKSFSDISWSKPDIIFQILKASYMPMRRISAADDAKKKARDKVEAAAGAGTTESANVATPTATTTAKKAAATQTADKAKNVKASGETESSPSDELQAIRNRVKAAAKVVGGIYPEGHKQENFAGKTEPDYAKLIFKKEYKCPACAKPFDDFKIFSSKLYEAQEMRYDLRKFYKDFKTEWYDVITCRNCLFSTFSNYFIEPKPLKKDLFENELTKARENVHIDFAAERDLAYVFTSYYLALLCAEGYINQKRQIKAKLWGSLSWLYEDEKDTEMMKFAALNAAEQYEDVYTNTNLTPVQEQVTCLSIAGMQHRAGIEKNMKKYLFSAKTIKFGDARFAKIADEFMYDLRISEE